MLAAHIFWALWALIQVLSQGSPLPCQSQEDNQFNFAICPYRQKCLQQTSIILNTSSSGTMNSRSRSMAVSRWHEVSCRDLKMHFTCNSVDHSNCFVFGTKASKVRNRSRSVSPNSLSVLARSDLQQSQRIPLHHTPLYQLCLSHCSSDSCQPVWDCFEFVIVKIFSVQMLVSGELNTSLMEWNN